MIVGLISSYREGHLVAGAIRTLEAACDRIVVFEGPVGDAPKVGEASELGARGVTVVRATAPWESDAAKRTAMLRYAKHRYGPAWGVWLDGDELLINGEWLPDHLRAAEYQGAQVGGFAPYLIELDGSISKAHCRCVRLDLIEHYVIGAHVFELAGSGMIVSLPNVPVLKEEWWKPRAETPTLYGFPPLPGEPHIVHRSGLRPPDRNALRLHAAEGAWFEERDPRVGVGQPPMSGFVPA